ncbi:MAG: GNAT family N-acetyltransferase [Hyphomonadaceae bacterium]|nr:GNAT family N-acetyltransferase [Hyphomonadaceae bacterium]
MAAIRDIRAGDKAGWLPLWRGYLDFYEAPFDAEIADLSFARLLDPTEPMFALVAERDGALIGIVHCILHRSMWTRGDYCYLQDLFAAPEARGQGVGRALIEAVYARADALGCARVYWLTQESNATARLLYDRVAKASGFIQYRR